ncbi:hypothetical protein D1BOALGB6SA_7410 [Olavius sp. associated proteobacterium Delta 1]|nr:hypothetical protein D1BOALGB6SA_7410 [Olavius sp. associated proteobacterium Delta 1]
MTDDKPDKKALARFRTLRERRQQLMALEPKDAMQRILLDPQPLALVHSFPEQDFYFLIHDIGPEDAVPLLSLASNRQWEHLVDLETWQKDQIDSQAVSRWLDLLLEADPPRFVNWFLNEKLEFVEFFLYQNIEVRVREHDQDPSELGQGFFSLDDTYFIRFIDQSADAAENELTEQQRKKFITRLADALSNFDHRLYQGVLLEATHVIPAETEEDCFRRRNVRLAEKGFLPFDEAIGIYQPVKPQDLAQQSAKIIPSAEDPASLFPVPQYPIRLLMEDDHFSRVLTTIESENVASHIQAEFANLCNQIIVADHKTIRERDQLRDIVKKACGYISIGLELLSKVKIKVDPSRAAALIARYPLSNIFRVGFGEALKLKWQTEKWLDQCWYARNGLRLTFWGQQWLGVLGGLLIKKPLYYDNYKTGVLYREFDSLEDVRTTAEAFSQIKAIDGLLSLMSIDIDRPSAYGFLTYKNLILTLWARHHLQLSAEKLKPITQNEFKPFFDQLLPGQPANGPSQKRKVPRPMKQNFLDWLAADTGLKDFEITARLGQTLENLFEEIESELDRVSGQDLDPRYVQLFLLEDT